MGILSSTCKRNSSRHQLSPSYRHRHKSLDKNFFLNNSTSNNTINNSSNQQNDHNTTKYTQLTASTRDNSSYSLTQRPSSHKSTSTTKSRRYINPSNTNTNTNINQAQAAAAAAATAAAVASSLKQLKKSRSLSALDQIHIIITNIDLPPQSRPFSAHKSGLKSSSNRRINYKKVCQAEIYAFTDSSVGLGNAK